MTDIFLKIDARRKELGWSAYHLCGLSGVKPSTYCKMRRPSHSHPYWDTVAALCEALDLDPITLEVLPQKPNPLVELKTWLCGRVTHAQTRIINGVESEIEGYELCRDTMIAISRKIDEMLKESSQ
jgi:hypothetical protein